MQLTKEKIKEIAEDLDCGFVIYIHKQTKVVKSFMDIDQAEYYSTTGEIQEGKKEVEDNYFDYLRIDKMSTNRAFRVMEAFIYEVDDIRIRAKLLDALEKRKPFQNFKHEVGFNEDVRQQWFKFKEQQYIKYVETALIHFDEEE